MGRRSGVRSWYLCCPEFFQQPHCPDRKVRFCKVRPPWEPGDHRYPPGWSHPKGWPLKGGGGGGVPPKPKRKVKVLAFGLG